LDFGSFDQAWDRFSTLDYRIETTKYQPQRSLPHFKIVESEIAVLGGWNAELEPLEPVFLGI
jgi:hypothetical protein